MNSDLKKLIDEYGSRLRELAEQQLRELLEGGYLQGAVADSLQGSMRGVIWSLLGISKSFDDINIKHDSALFDKLNKQIENAAQELIKKHLKMPVELTVKEKAKLERSYRDQLLSHLSDLVSAKAEVDATFLFEKLDVELQKAYKLGLEE